MSDSDVPREVVPGLPELLPAGEYIRWRGKPDWKDLAIHGFHLRKLAVYFSLLLVARVVVQGNAGAPMGETLASTAVLAVLGGLVLGFIAVYAWLAARGAQYTLTNRRIVIRCGATLPMTINLPFEKVVSADLKVRRDGHGDLPITLDQEIRPSWIIIWPHVKPWSLLQPRPMLRSVPDARRAGEQVAEALREFAEGAAPVEAPRIVRDATVTLPPRLSASAG